MVSKQKPKWTRPRYRRVPDGRCGQCGWQPADGHSPSCPSRYTGLTTAEGIAEARVALMAWSEKQNRLREWGQDISALTAAVAAGLSARAREIGAEDDRPGDNDVLDMWRR